MEAMHTQTQIVIESTAVYSMRGEMAYQIDYSDGTKVRAVETKGGFIRKEYSDGDAWKLSGKPYIVKKNSKRTAEVIKTEVVSRVRAALSKASA